MVNKKVLDDYIESYRLNRTYGVTSVTANDLSQLKSSGYNVEDLFNHLSQHYQSLLHGSRTEISDDRLKPDRTGKIYSSRLAAIAIMRAIMSNKGLQHPGLQYPYFIDEKHPLEIRIYGINGNTIGNN